LAAVVSRFGEALRRNAARAEKFDRNL
jgi:hypothetical protein